MLQLKPFLNFRNCSKCWAKIAFHENWLPFFSMRIFSWEFKSGGIQIFCGTNILLYIHVITNRVLVACVFLKFGHSLSPKQRFLLEDYLRTKASWQTVIFHDLRNYELRHRWHLTMMNCTLRRFFNLMTSWSNLAEVY